MLVSSSTRLTEHKNHTFSDYILGLKTRILRNSKVVNLHDAQDI